MAPVADDEPVKVYSASPADLDPLVRLHLRAFPEATMSKLGPRFLKEYYRTVLRYAPSWIGVVRSPEGEALASTSMVGNPPEFQAYLRRRVGPIALSLLPTLVRDPGKARLALKRAGGKPTVKLDEHTLEYVTMCVDPSTQGQGLGTKVIEQHTKVSVAMGFEKGVFTTNDEASGLPGYFRSIGYEVYERFEFDGREMHLMGRDLRGLSVELVENER